MRFKPGDRVGAVSHSDGETIYLFGYGVYLGDLHLPVGTVAGMVGTITEEDKDFPPNPCIKLDNGKIVWGCQCWWGGEKSVKEKVAKFEKVLDKELPDNPLSEEIEIELKKAS